MLSLYIHIPFCISKCAYCSFYSAPAHDGEADEYVRSLCSQLSVFDGSTDVCTVYFGGGTPSLLGPERVARVMKAVNGAFSLTRDCEVTLEANPGTVFAGQIEKYRECGINRLSIGMQTSDERMLALLGRCHSHSDTVRLVGEAKDAGLDNISLDIISALPGKDIEGSLADVKSALELGPKHISVYLLTLEKETRMYELKDVLSFPDETMQREAYLSCCETLEKAGYEHYEISNFALPSYRSRHNMRYWERGEYLGFGPHAHSFYKNRRFSCGLSTNEYINRALCGESVFDVSDYSGSEQLSASERREEEIMLGLRLSDGVILEGKAAEKATRLEKLGLMRSVNGRWSLTDEGMIVSNAVISELIV